MSNRSKRQLFVKQNKPPTAVPKTYWTAPSGKNRSKATSAFEFRSLTWTKALKICWKDFTSPEGGFQNCFLSFQKFAIFINLTLVPDNELFPPGSCGPSGSGLRWLNIDPDDDMSGRKNPSSCVFLILFGSTKTRNSVQTTKLFLFRLPTPD